MHQDKNTKMNNIIPFSPRKSNNKNTKVTAIAIIIAVEVLHNNNENPEDKLMELIEASGEIEILDSIDATDNLEAYDQEQKNLSLKPLNDN